MADWKEFYDSSKIPKYRVELHIHLDGSVRPETIWEISQRKGFQLASSSEVYRSSLVTKQPSNLANFLAPIATYLPVIAGDEEAIERIAYEFCEDAALEHILYAETRYSPHLLSTESFPPERVVECVNRGLQKGCERFGVDIRSILCSIRGRPAWSKEVVELCQKFRDEGVIAMDIAGDTEGVVDTSEEDKEAFQLAYRLGIHRTVHAGEDGPADQVRFALEHLFAERIGHGYHVVEDDSLYRRCLDMDVHFEACPHSSLLTGAVMDRTVKHPIVRFAEDRANFSINRDDSTLIQKTLDDDYQLLRNQGLNDLHLARATTKTCTMPLSLSMLLFLIVADFPEALAAMDYNNMKAKKNSETDYYPKGVQRGHLQKLSDNHVWPFFSSSDIFQRQTKSAKKQCQILVQKTEMQQGSCTTLADNTPACHNDQYLAINFNEC